MKGLTPIILILVSVAAFFFFIDPQYKEIKSLMVEKDKNEVAIQKAEQLRRDRGLLQEKYNKISDKERDTLALVLPDTVDNVRLILDINNIATNYGITLKGISVSGGPIDESSDISRSSKTASGQQSYGTIQLGFSVTADYDVFKTFMRDLEDSLRLVDITDFSVAGSDTGFYNYSLTLNTYWLR